MKIFLILLSVFSILTIATGVAAMMFFGNKEREVIDIVLMSPLEGVLTYQGKPLPNKEMKLWLRWKDEEGENFTYVTDVEGRFSIPEHKVRDSLNPFAQLVIRQELTVEHDNLLFEVWIRSKLRPQLFTELNGRPVGLVCDLAAEEVAVKGEGSLGVSICRWETLEKNSGEL